MHVSHVSFVALFALTLILASCEGSGANKPSVKLDSILIEIAQRNRLASLNPDRTQLAYDVFEDGRDVVRIKNLVTGDEELLTIEGLNLKAPKWSPDGASILMHGVRQGAVQLVQYSTDAGKFEYLTSPERGASRGDWHPNGRKIAYVSNIDGSYDIFVLDLDEQLHRKITDNPGNEYWPRWSPDGEAITFYHSWNEWTNLAIANVATGRVESLTNNQHEDYRPAFSSDGLALFFSSDRWDDGGIGYYDLHSNEISHVKSTIVGVDYISPLIDGSGLFHAEQFMTNAYETHNSGATREIQVGEGDRSRVALSPNGNRLVYAAWFEDSRQIFSMNLDGGDIQRHTNTRHLYADPFYTPDGALWVLRSGGDYAHSRLGVLDLSSGTYVERDDSPSTQMPVACGGFIYFLSAEVAYQSHMTLFELDYRDGSKRKVTDQDIEVGGLGCLPDGNILASMTFDDDVDLAVINTKNGDAQRYLNLQGVQYDPAVSPDGSRVAFATRDDDDFNIAVVERAALENVTELATSDGRRRRPVWLSDDQLVWVNERASTRWVISTFE